MNNLWSGKFLTRIVYGSIWVILQIIQMPFNIITGLLLNIKFILSYYIDFTAKAWKAQPEDAGEIENATLPGDLFVRIHRSFIVNIEAIAKIELYEKESYKVQLKSGASIKASAAGYKLLRQKM
jgi:hypothetical protein